MRITHRQLKYFIEIARTGSITTAASSLGIAQPALSHHIAAIEEELGVVLFERHARGVKLTAEGQRLLDRGASILRQMDRLRDDVRNAGGKPRGPVSLCIAGAVAAMLAAPLYRFLERETPDVRLTLTTGMSTEARALIESRRVDMALMPTAFELPGLEAHAVFEETFFLFGSVKLLEGKRKPVRFKELGMKPLVAPDRDHDLRKLIERTALSLNVPLNVRYESNSAELSRALVTDGLALAIMPSNAFPDPARADVVARELIEPSLSRTQSIVWVADQPLTPAGVAVHDALLAVIASLIEQQTLKGSLAALPGS
jgi:LysR family nitrogen assimilation transcriptional regulator